MKTVVVHRGARDAYQVARSLQDAGLLDKLVTDLYWPAESTRARTAGALLPSKLTDALKKRYADGLDSANVEARTLSGLASFVLEKLPVPFALRQTTVRRTDTSLGRRARSLARRNGSALLSYSYYAHAAFGKKARDGNFDGTRILFQLHPHPASVRRILAAELQKHPDCAPSLSKEWELSLPQPDFDRLSAEASLADHCLCASSFTRQTLVENGVDRNRIHVIPYGVDSARFSPAGQPRITSGPLKLLFVGTINQRKGIKYLLEALRLLDVDKHDAARHVEVRVCGRAVDDLSLFRPFGDRIQVTPSVSDGELIEAYRHADLFVFPSVAEGFAQVLLESLACGLPVLSTTRTAGPDIVTEGESGFVLPPCEAESLAARIDWALTHRERLSHMRAAARARAEYFTWQRFRTGVAAAVEGCLASPTSAIGATAGQLVTS